MQITEEMWADVIRRLDAQAKAIREIRAGASAGATDSTGDAGRLPAWHPYAPSDKCAMCGQPKGKGRTALTCRDCASDRSSIIKNGGDRASITRSVCFSCGDAFKPQTRFLCRPCGAGHKIWVALQK